MKGVVFAEFIEMVEDKFSPQVADQIIELSDLPSGGAYTSVGTYDHGEILSLVTRLSEESEIEVPDLVQIFGRHLFTRFAEKHGAFFAGVPSAFSLLKRVHGHIHVEVLKLYPDAELPSVSCEELGGGQMMVVYKSPRPFADLAEGLIRGCIEHFGEAIELEREDRSTAEQTHVRFLLSTNRDQ